MLVMWDYDVGHINIAENDDGDDSIAGCGVSDCNIVESDGSNLHYGES